MKYSGRVRLKVVVWVLLGMVMLTACAKPGDVSKEMYEELVKEIEVVRGVRVDELEVMFMSFINHVYNPNTNEDIETGIALISDFLSDAVEKEFRSMIIEVDNEKNSIIRDVEVRYSVGENNGDGLPRVYTEFTLEVEGLQQKKAIEFVFNVEGEIFRYYFWEGILEKVGE